MDQLNIHSTFENPFAVYFCDQFLNSSSPKFVFGTNEFAESISLSVEIDGFVDDFSKEGYYLDKPIVPIDQIPPNALVVSAVTIGKPIKAEKRLKQFQFRSLDYFSFYKYSNIKLEEIWYWRGFEEDFQSNSFKYEWLMSMLNDRVSKNQLNNILNFRLSYDLNYMRGFSPIEERQYFESFLNLNIKGKESFADIGAFDGYTSNTFITHCPDYRNIFLFEPDPNNIQLARAKLQGKENINFFQIGLSNKKATLRLNSNGPNSTLGPTGEQTVKIERLDNVLHEPVSFIKMDIEGAESDAIEGARQIIAAQHPKMAIAAYHKADDLWRLAEQVLAIREDYQLYLRHYTEGFAETVLFFIPDNL